MSVALCSSAVHFGVRYAKSESGFSAASGLKVGAIWFGICLAIDLPLFLFGFGMSLSAYSSDIAISYLMVPVVVGGLGAISTQRAQ